MKFLINRAGESSSKTSAKLKVIMTSVFSQVDKMAQPISRHLVTFFLPDFLLTRSHSQVNESFLFPFFIRKLWLAA